MDIPPNPHGLPWVPAAWLRSVGRADLADAAENFARRERASFERYAAACPSIEATINMVQTWMGAPNTHDALFGVSGAAEGAAAGPVARRPARAGAHGNRVVTITAPTGLWLVSVTSQPGPSGRVAYIWRHVFWCVLSGASGVEWRRYPHLVFGPPIGSPDTDPDGNWAGIAPPASLMAAMREAAEILACHQRALERAQTQLDSEMGPSWNPRFMRSDAWHPRWAPIRHRIIDRTRELMGCIPQPHGLRLRVTRAHEGARLPSALAA